jgi:phospholipid/cholesterol/gamma-HCH transport system ATP-binding protein
MTPPAPTDPIIEVENLVTHYGRRRILDDINLRIHPGEIMVIMGASGSGKSTLLWHLLGLKRPTSGTIKLLGQDINRIGAPAMQGLRRKMGGAFQGGALFSSMSVEDNITLPLREHTQLDDKTMSIMARLKLEVVNLAGFGSLMPSQLSGGMIKRAACARATIMAPPLLFFDEPSAGRDPVEAAELDNVILRLREAMNTTIVVVTHELESTFKIADRITVLDQGQILLVGSVDQVRASTQPRVRDLLNRTPREIPVDADDYLDRLTDDETGPIS